jgi:iron complex outermembrane receptor protein
MSKFISSNRSLRARLLFGAAMAATVAVSSPVWAQQTGQPMETVVVTGTMFQRQNYDTPSPIQVIGADQIQKSGLTSMADVLQNIPDNNSGAVTSSFTGALAFGGSGV